MAIFTAIMGNAFAAFSVITAGIGLPFVFAQGGDPVICSILALTAGFCGTLVTQWLQTSTFYLLHYLK